MISCKEIDKHDKKKQGIRVTKLVYMFFIQTYVLLVLRSHHPTTTSHSCSSLIAPPFCTPLPFSPFFFFLFSTSYGSSKLIVSRITFQHSRCPLQSRSQNWRRQLWHHLRRHVLLHFPPPLNLLKWLCIYIYIQKEREKQSTHTPDQTIHCFVRNPTQAPISLATNRSPSSLSLESLKHLSCVTNTVPTRSFLVLVCVSRRCRYKHEF